MIFSGIALSQNTIIAIVNNTPILASSIENILLSGKSNEEKIDLINAEIDLQLQLENIEKFNLQANEKNINEVLKDIAKKNNLSIEELLDFDGVGLLKKEVFEKLSILNLQRFVTKDLDKPTRLILNECSNTNLEKDQKQIKIAQIIISQIDSDTNDIEQKNLLIKSFLNKLSNHISKGASFEAFSKLHSQHPSYKDGGVTEWLTVNSPTIEMLDSLEINKVSDIYSTDFGLAIAIKIDERFISSKLKACEERVIYQNAEIYYAQWLKNLREQAIIKIYYDKLN